MINDQKKKESIFMEYEERVTETVVDKRRKEGAIDSYRQTENEKGERKEG